MAGAAIDFVYVLHLLPSNMSADSHQRIGFGFHLIYECLLFHRRIMVAYEKYLFDLF